MSDFKRAVPSDKPKFTPHPYQFDGIKHLLQHPDAGLFYPPGLGKTATTLAAFVTLKKKGVVDKMLVIAPLRVCHMVWPYEVEDWADFEGLSVGVLHGNNKGKVLAEQHDIYVINPDGLQWLLKQKVKFDLSWMLVVDESTVAKNGSSKRSKMMHKMARDFGRSVILTGTPAPNGLINLWSQVKILDGGERLGKYITGFRNRYFYPSGYMGYEYKLQDGAESRIYSAIEDIILHKSQDELDLPERLYNTIKVQLPDKAMKIYNDMKDHLIAELGPQELAVAMNAAVVTGKLKQITNGGMWNEGEIKFLHDAKTDVVESLTNELDGRPLLVMYEYKHDLERLLDRFPGAPHIGGGVSTKKSDGICNRWNRGELPLLLVHPACLHPETEVLTEYRGWVKIIEVRSDEKVHDGVEFVNHTGCQYSGYKEVVERFGIFMTPDHKLLIDDVWVEAKDVKSDLHTKRKALFSVGATNEVSICPMPPMRKRSGDALTKCAAPQQKGEQALLSMYEGSVPLYDGDSFLEFLAWSTLSSKRLIRQKLWWSWDICVSTMGGVQELLRRYAPYLQGWVDNRTCRCQQRVLQGELHMGNSIETTVEQKEQSTVGVPRGEDAPSRAMPKNGTGQGETNPLPEQTQQRRGSSESCDGIEIPKQPQKSHVYDLVNCGPRNRFLIRNPDGEVFISHNSAGHGLNLQKGGCHDVCWYSIPFDLELYDQANARVHRQGVKNSVTVHHIVAEDTIDEAIMRLLKRKDKVQTALLEYLL